jgi:NADH:ubiquinone oxidoreductase subunit 2 (subunit N)
MKHLTKKNFLYITTGFIFPLLAAAQTNITSLQSLGTFTIDFINTVLVPVIFALAFIVFIFGVFQYFILARGNEEAQGQAKSLMLWGLIGFFVMVSVWGLVNILLGTFNLSSQAVPTYPNAPQQ